LLPAGRRLLALAWVALCVLSAGCGQDRTAPGQAAADVLRRGNGGDPGSLDPALAEDLHAYNVLGDLYEGLVVATADGGLAPGVASDWTSSADGLDWRFRLRPDAAWSNGERVTAAHFVAALRHAVDPATGSPNAFLLEPIANASAILRGQRAPAALGVRAEGDDLLAIELERPARWLPTVLSMSIALPRLPGVHDDPASFTTPSRFVGNGPYRLEGWRPGGELRLLRNPRFRAAAEVAIPEVRWLSLADPAAEFNLYRAGELDVTATVPPAQFASLARERPCELQSAPGLGLYYIAFDVTEPPLDDPKLREALSLAIDRDRLVAMLDRGEVPAYGIVPPAIAPAGGAAHDWRALPSAERIRLARAALAESRHAKEPPEIQLTYDAGDVHEQVALAVRAMWQEALGVEATLRQLEWKAFLDQRGDRSAWQAMRFVWVGDYDDASTFTGLYASGGENNLPGYANPRYDTLVEEAARTADGARRDGLLRDAERMLLGDHPVAPLYFMTSKHLVAPRVAGFVPNALDRHPSRWLRLDAVSPRSGSSAAARCGSGDAVS
jgi:oligopeptide transport system substrate-binding protein